MALGTVCLSLLLLTVHSAHSSYVALTPSTFRPGYTYSVLVSVTDVPSGSVTIRGDILDSKNQSVADETVIINGDASGKLDIPVNANIKPEEGYAYTLKLVGSGGLTFTNTTPISIDFTTKLVLVQTDKGIYKPGQLVRYRILVLNKDLVPQKLKKNITIENPAGSTLAQHQDDGTKLVYEETFQLTEFTELGDWKIKVIFEESSQEETTFTVEEYVLPKFEVSAKINPEFLVKEDSKVLPEQTTVTVEITAMYTYGKGVLGKVKLTTGKQEIFTEITDPSGKKDVEVDLVAQLKRNYIGEITIDVEVTDETQRKYSTQAVLSVKWRPVKIEFDPSYSDKVFHQGLPATFVVKVTDPVGAHLLDEKYKDSEVTMQLSSYSDETATQKKTFSWNDGQPFVWKTENIMSTANVLTLSVYFKVGEKTYDASDSIQAYQTVGRAALDLKWKSYTKPDLTLGNTLTFALAVSDPSHFSAYTYMIVSRGNIQAFGSASVGDNSVEVTTDMCPKGRLIVYGITTKPSASSTPEIIADSLKLKLEHCQDKKVVPSVPVSTQRTGTDAKIRVDVSWTNPNRNDQIGEHSVYMLAVDKSILLLQEGNDLTPAEVDKKLEKFDLSSDYSGGVVPLRRFKRMVLPHPYPSDQQATSTGELLKIVGLTVLSDADMKVSRRIMYARPEIQEVAAGVMRKGGKADENENAVFDKQPSGGQAVAATAVTVRKDFPDTWIWKTALTDASGQLSMMERLPDSITSWSISAFAVRDNTELALTPEPFELSAFNPFFVSLNLPYSIRRSEKFQMRCTVFNYQPFDVNAIVTLASSPDFDISGNPTQTIMVKSNSADSVNFLIEATTIKTIDIQVTAQSQRSDGVGDKFTDVVNKKLIVKPEGVMRMKVETFAVLLSSEQPSFTTVVDRDISDKIVPDSITTIVKVTGDMMGNVLSNIDKLVTQPTGCGEQNMITTVPNIYAWTYLEAINDLTSEFKELARKYMQQGYSKEKQMYRWVGGGYSAFGEQSDDAASIWLTAFVIRSFAQARQFIPDVVEVTVLTDDINYLLKNQDSNGAFMEKGRVIHAEMQGGTGGGHALSVYITMCLLEVQKYGFEIDSKKLTAAVNNVRTIANEIDVKNNQFLAAITAYTLALHDPNDGTVGKLIEDIKEGEAPWEKTKEKKEEKTKMSDNTHQAGTFDVEITAYTIMALVTIGQSKDARDLVLWLQKQQNGYGGFCSTQDTTMALQAISEYAASFDSVASSTVSISTMDPVMPTKTVTIDRNNKALLQIIELPDETKRLKVTVQGQENSFSVVKVVWYYYTLPEKETPGGSGDKLKISSNVVMLGPGLFKATLCMETDQTLNPNNMMVVEFNSPSGVELNDILEARRQNTKVKRLEQTENENQYNFYLDEPITECLQFKIEQSVVVEDRKPGSVRLYAYYNTDFRAESDVTMPLSCPPSGCCIDDNCDTSHAAHYASLSGLLLSACICLLLSVLIAV